LDPTPRFEGCFAECILRNNVIFERVYNILAIIFNVYHIIENQGLFLLQGHPPLSARPARKDDWLLTLDAPV
jgi:hypothetical protein